MVRASSSSTHVLPGCCFTSSTARSESASGVARLVQASANRVGPAEGVRGADQREERVALGQRLEREAEPFDVGRRRGRVLGRPQKGHVGAVPARDVRDLLGVGGHDHTLESVALERGLDGVREEGVTRELAHVLLRHPLGARARRDEGDRGRRGHRSPAAAASSVSVGHGTPRLSATSTPPTIASSSESRPTATSRAADVVVSSAISSMIAHCADGRSRPRRPTRQHRPRRSPSRGEDASSDRPAARRRCARTRPWPQRAARSSPACARARASRPARLAPRPELLQQPGDALELAARRSRRRDGDDR